MENKNCEAKKRILSQTKFLNQILNFQTKIQRCVELSGTLEYLVNWSLFPNNFDEINNYSRNSNENDCCNGNNPTTSAKN
jgi:hypothetical protein